LLLLAAAACDFHGRPGRAPADYAAAAAWQSALAAVQAVDAGAIARACSDKARIPQQIHQARVAAVKALRAAQE
jgi:tRNA nucleotidyltransferase (CCA-adding enzyme)